MYRFCIKNQNEPYIFKCGAPHTRGPEPLNTGYRHGHKPVATKSAVLTADTQKISGGTRPDEKGGFSPGPNF